MESLNLEIRHNNKPVLTIQCATHTFQLGCKLFLSYLKKSLDKVRSVILKLRTPTFRVILKSYKLPVPKKDNDTRWFL